MAFAKLLPFRQAEGEMRRRGFTLIEVLVTMTIIGVLFAITAGIYSAAEMRSRDQQRLTDLATINNALEQYHLDNHSYPLEGYGENNIFAAKFQLQQVGDCYFTQPTGKTYLTPAYIDTIPEDPIYKLNHTGQAGNCNTNQYGQYLYVAVTTDSTSSVQSYYLMARMEQTQNMSATTPSAAQLGFYGTIIDGANSPLVLCNKTNNSSSCTQNYYLANNPN